MRANISRILPIALACTFVSVIPHSLAQSSDTLETIVVTASRSEQSIREVGSNISQIKDLRSIGQVHINETMQRIPGVWISRGNGQEHLTAIRSPVLTGAGGCGAFLMAQDNLPLRASGFCNVNELFDANSEQAGSIEVVKGPGSVLYGSNAMHGMVNIITAEPDGRSNLTAEAGPDDYYRVKLSTSTDKWRADINGTSDGGFKHDSGFDQQKATFKLKHQLLGFSASTVLSLSNLNQETAGFVLGEKAYEDASLRRFNPNPEAYRDSKSLRLYSTMRQKIGAGEFIFTPYLRSTRMQFIQHFLPGQAVEENRHTSIGFQSAWHYENWTFGADLEATRGALKESQANATESGSAFLVATIPAGDHYDYEVDATTAAVFVQYQTNITEKTRITLGGRIEQVRYDYDNQMISGRTRADGTPCGFGGCRFNRPEDGKDSFTNFSPRLGITHTFSDNMQLYAQLARGYRAPQATELYRLQNSQSVSRIDSEELDSIEVGLRGQANSLTYDISTYAMRKDNFIFRDSNRSNVDNGKTSHSGIEVNLSYQISETINASLAASYARHQYKNNPALTRSAVALSGNDIDTAPRKTGAMRINWQASSSVSAELEVIYLGKYYEDPENLNEYEGHTLANVRIAYKINDSIDTFIRIVNLTDKDYAERADFSFGSDRYFVGQPITVYAGFTTHF